MRRHAPFELTDPNICTWGGVDVLINCANFFENPSKGFRADRLQKTAFPIDFVFAIYVVAHKGLIQHGVHLLHDDTIHFQKLDTQTNQMIPISIGCTSGGGRS